MLGQEFKKKSYFPVSYKVLLYPVTPKLWLIPRATPIELPMQISGKSKNNISWLFLQPAPWSVDMEDLKKNSDPPFV